MTNPLDVPGSTFHVPRSRFPSNPEPGTRNEEPHNGVLAPGTRLADRFSLVRLVGRGGMGVVYEAIDEKLNRRVALKCAQPGHGHRLPPEARAAREVSHFNVCKVHDVHVVSTAEGEIDVLSMEFVDGETVSQRIHRDGPLPPDEAREITRQICDGLAQAHRQGVIHGDLKGANVILGRSPQGAVRAVITDFGLARLELDPDGHERGGTADYMAPELKRGGRATVASDLYALAVTLHVMLTGHTPEHMPRLAPMPMRAPEIADGNVTTQTEPRTVPVVRTQPRIAELPRPWKGIVARCLQPDPANRPASAEEISRALEPRRWRWQAAGAVAAAILLAVVYWQGQEPVLGPPVRLAVLPLAAATAEGPVWESSVNVGIEIARRLTGLRRNFTVIPPADAVQNRVDSPDKAKFVLGATHVLQTSVSASGREIAAAGFLIDLQSGRSIRQLTGTYPSDDPVAMAKALVAVVTTAFRLPAGAPSESLAEPAGAAYLEGMGLLRQSSTNGAKAIPYFERAIGLEPQSALPHAGLAEAQLQRFIREGGGWLDLASANVEKARSLNADSVPVLLVSGAVAQERGLHEEAIRDLTRAAELEPTNSEAWRRLAISYERTNRADDAIATYQKAIQAQPDYYRHYLSFGNFYLTRSQFDRAEAMYRKVTEVAPGLPAGHANLGLALMQQGRFREAEASLLTSLKIQESAQLLLNIGALYYAQERYVDALAFFQRSLAAGPPTVIRYANLGDAFRHLERPKEAAAAYRQAVDLAEREVARNPRQALSRAILGMLAAQLGDNRRAEFELSQAVALEPENATVVRQAAIAYEALGQREKTLALLSQAPLRLLEELGRQPDVKSLRQDGRFQELLAKKKTG